MQETIFSNKSIKQKYEHLHCPCCGTESVNLAGGKGKFIGNVGGMVFRCACKSCNSEFTLVITGDEFFPERGFKFGKKDLDVLFGRTA